MDHGDRTRIDNRAAFAPFQRCAAGQTSVQGFTLLETLVVLVVLSLMVGLVVARGPSRSSTVDLRAAAGRLAEVLRGTPATAIATGAPTQVEVDLLEREARGNGATLVLAAPIRLTYTAINGRTAVAGRTVIAFGADGSSSGGVFGLVVQALRKAVVIDAFTGRVDVADGV